MSEKLFEFSTEQWGAGSPRSVGFGFTKTVANPCRIRRLVMPREVCLNFGITSLRRCGSQLNLGLRAHGYDVGDSADLDGVELLAGDRLTLDVKSGQKAMPFTAEVWGDQGSPSDWNGFSMEPDPEQTKNESSKATGEALYDAVLAPKLLEVAGLCKEAGIPMLATVWFDGDASGTTRVLPTDRNAAFTLAHAANRCRGNIDNLCIALARDIPEEHDGSIVLRWLRGANKGEPPSDDERSAQGYLGHASRYPFEDR